MAEAWRGWRLTDLLSGPSASYVTIGMQVHQGREDISRHEHLDLLVCRPWAGLPVREFSILVQLRREPEDSNIHPHFRGLVVLNLSETLMHR